MPLCLRRNAERCISQVVLESDLFRVAHNIYTIENILHNLRFPTWLESQDALPKSSERSYTVPNLVLVIQIFAFETMKQKTSRLTFFLTGLFMGKDIKTYHLSFTRYLTIFPLNSSVKCIKLKRKIKSHGTN